jgi:hypothetical protein
MSGGVQMWWGVDWAAWLLSVSTAVLAVGIIGALYGIFSSRKALREDARARNTSVFLEIGRRWDDPDVMHIRAATYDMEAGLFYAYFHDLERLEQIKARKIANFFEDLAVLESLGSLDMQWIEESMGTTIATYWKLWELVTLEERQTEARADAALLYENWENLAKKVVQLRDRREYHHPRKGRWHRRKHF